MNEAVQTAAHGSGDFWSLTLRVRARVVHRARRDPPGQPAAAHAAHVASPTRSRRSRWWARSSSPAVRDPPLIRLLGAIALFASMTNIVSGFLITRSHAADVQDRREAARRRQGMTDWLVQFGYLVASALFIFALHWMNDPKTARRGVSAGVAGMAIAVVATWAQPAVVHHLWIVVADHRRVRRRRSRSRGCRSPRCRSGPRCRMRSAALAAGLVGTAEVLPVAARCARDADRRSGWPRSSSRSSSAS